MTKSIYEFINYQDYLLERWGGKDKRTGKKIAAAAHAGIQTAYLSQVLGGRAHLSLEQAQRLNGFLEHDKEESHFFLLLVQHNRAGTSELKSYFEDQMKAILQKRRDLKGRIKVTQDIKLEDQSEYYSHWLYLAVYVALSVPELQTKTQLAHHFGVRVDLIHPIVEFLVRTGLAQTRGSRYVVGPNHIHLGNESKNILKHHTNWRLQALRALERSNSPLDLHYSGVFSISKKDAQKLRDRLVQTVKELSDIILPSKEELIICHNFDFFQL